MSKAESGALEVPLDDIKAEGNIRTFSGSDGPMKELIASVKRLGVLEPVLLTSIKDPAFKWQLVSGFRRYTAACEAGVDTIPARDLGKRTAADVGEIRLSENLQRLDMNPIEEGLALRAWMKDAGLNREAAAEQLGRSTAWVAFRLRFLDFPEEVQDLIAARRLPVLPAMNLLPYLEKNTPALLLKLARAAAERTGGPGEEARFKALLEKAERRPPPARSESSGGACTCGCRCCRGREQHSVPGG